MAEGKTYGSYVVEGELGQGGMGSVFLGQHRLLERPAVLKKMRREFACDRDLVERFRREARAAAAVHHPNVVAVYDCFSHRGDLVIAQEYVDGVDLATAMSTARRIPPRIATLIALELARGLEEVHGQGIIHRDLKPANILLGSGGETKIADFGIALEGRGDGLTQPGVMMGSPPYIPPEQIMGERVDYRGDLFNWAVVFYEMLTGVPPFRPPQEDERETLLQRIQRGRYTGLRSLAPETPRYARRLIYACLRARPTRRVQSATRLRRTLERRLRSPSPAHCRNEIARWLWEHQVITPNTDATVMAPAPDTEVPLPHPALGWSTAALVGTLAAVAVLVMGVDCVALAPDIAVDAVEKLKSAAPEALESARPGSRR